MCIAVLLNKACVPQHSSRTTLQRHIYNKWFKTNKINLYSRQVSIHGHLQFPAMANDPFRKLGSLVKKKKSPSPSRGTTRTIASNSSSDLFNLETPPLTPLSLLGYSPTTKNRLLSREIAEEIRGIVPPRQQITSEWNLVYSLEQHGASLTTLYRNIKPDSKHDRGSYVLVIKDHRNGIFGAFVNEYFHPTDTRRFYGNGECFLWKAQQVKFNEDEESRLQFRAFPYTGLNDFIIYCTSEFLSLGGGDGHYGLWVDHDLINGVTGHSLTFGNEPLSEAGTKFGILGVEVWRIG